MADALLLTGDEDIRVGVQQAQEFGVRVHLLGSAPARENQSGFLVQEADSVRELSLTEVQSFLSRTTIPERTTPTAAPLGAAPVPAPLGSLEAAARQIAGKLKIEGDKGGVEAHVRAEALRSRCLPRCVSKASEPVR